MIIVSDTGPLLHLSEAKCLGLLRLAGEVHIPPMVAEEISHLLPQFFLPEWISVTPLEPDAGKEASTWIQSGILDYGEAQALALSRQINADWFLTDDAAARLLSDTIRIEVHGSLGLVLWAAVDGQVTYVDALTNLDNLAQSSLWISPRIITRAREALRNFFNK